MLRVLFLAALTFLTTPAFGQELVVMGLRQGMPYEAARRILIDQSWQADVTNPMYKDSLQQALQEFFIKRGFHEVAAC